MRCCCPEDLDGGQPAGGGGGPGVPTTLDQAIIAQGAASTTAQGFNTTIRLSNNFGWVWADAASGAIMTINGDGPALAVAIVGGNTAAGAGQGVSISSGPSTTAGQASGSLAFSTGTTTDGDTGGFSFTSPNATGANRSGGDFVVTLGSGTGTAEGGDFNVLCGAGSAGGSGGDFDVTGGAGGTTGAGGLCARRGGPGGSTTGPGGNIVDVTGDGGPGGSNAGNYVYTGGFATAGNGNGGGGTWTGGNALGTGIAGGFAFVGGVGGVAGGGFQVTCGANGTLPGPIDLRAGASLLAATRGAYINLQPGAGTGTGSGGVIRTLGRTALQQRQNIALAAASVNDQQTSPIGMVNWARITPQAGGSSITGLVAALEDGVQMLVTNPSAADSLTFVHDSASSAAANRIYCPGNVNYVLPPNGSVNLIYDLTSTHWRVISN